MSYDIKVTNKDNDTYLFSKVFREKVVEKHKHLFM